MTPLSSARSLSLSHLSILLTILSVAVGITTGCGTSSSGMPKLSGNTSVTLALSSTANDQLSEFDTGFTGISLTNQEGKTVNLLSAPLTAQQEAEFIHLNGGIEPLVTVSVPQDIYTAATVSVGDSDFSCLTLNPLGGIGLSIFAYGATKTNAPPTTVTVNLPSPITITGDSMALMMNLVVAQSASYTTCLPDNNQSFSITPTFVLTPLTLAAQPTNPGNGKVTSLEGEVASVNGSDLTLSIPEVSLGTRTLSVSSTSMTKLQGISGFSALSVGMFVNMDGAVQPDGSVLAARIAVEDPSAVNVLTGPLLFVDTLVPDLVVFGRQEQGPLLPQPSGGNSVYLNPGSFAFGGATFQISGEMTNLGTLPFEPSFTASNMVAGQNVDISTPAIVYLGSDVQTPANTLTLIPQTINGTVVASSPSGNFTDYTVSLASYDLFPTLAVQQGQTTLLTNPSTVEVYVDNNTQLLNNLALAPGNTLRFYGLLFNDNGTLRMDCAQVNDGVTGSSQSNSGNNMTPGRTQTIGHESPGQVQPAITVITRSNQTRT
jgi:Domain of unknown function (DUF5666)